MQISVLRSSNRISHRLVTNFGNLKSGKLGTIANDFFTSFVSRINLLSLCIGERIFMHLQKIENPVITDDSPRCACYKLYYFSLALFKFVKRI